MDGNSNIKDTADAIKGIVEAVPVYEDALQPAAKELGKGLHTLAQVVNVAISPLKALVWGYDQISEHLDKKLTEKLENVPVENIITPDPSVAVPAIESLRYNAHKEEIREMYTSLIASAMDKEQAKRAHPSFVEILKQLTPDEAKIFATFTNHMSRAVIKLRALNQNDDHYTYRLQEFTVIPYSINCEYPELGPSYINNLVRLGLIDINYTSYATLPNSYEPIYEHQKFKAEMQFIENNNMRSEVKRGTLCRTQFGENFYKTCID
ncbi:DUF4393 domain-containing protein [Jeotgalibacillus terrae]|uniref:DUF4393 domain-containing protein n=1 Tax=Jeotgalibacillus terrae TaxID=587735 RepID=A0ABW5ZLF5_9BACL|nr:DUF4393 domain-containing protein [Jeotgalibacillus terrae]MBM7579993.1 hypothetical protein [Jeotgalibacillus terrae]